MKHIVIDALGGDNAPGEVVKGCAQALLAFDDIELILCGDKETLERLLEENQCDKARVKLVHAPDVITFSDSPVLAVRRKSQSSIVKAFEQVASGQAQVFVSAGSTGAILAGGTLIIKRIKGVKRPALAPILPTVAGGAVMLVDCGANVDSKPANLVQFALMGSCYMSAVRGVDNPRIGLLNNGSEAEKGCELTKAAYKLLLDTPVNFVGNCEARDILSGEYDVVVADGFVGNILLKSLEGMADAMMSLLKTELYASSRGKLGGALAKPALRRLKKTMDHSEIGGALMLGVNGGVIKVHGSGNAKAVFNAIRQAREVIKGDIVNTIRRNIEEIEKDFE